MQRILDTKCSNLLCSGNGLISRIQGQGGCYFQHLTVASIQMPKHNVAFVMVLKNVSLHHVKGVLYVASATLKDPHQGCWNEQKKLYMTLLCLQWYPKWYHNGRRTEVEAADAVTCATTIMSSTIKRNTRQAAAADYNKEVHNRVVLCGHRLEAYQWRGTGCVLWCLKEELLHHRS